MSSEINTQKIIAVVLVNFMDLYTWVLQNYVLVAGIIFTVLGAIFTISEIRVYFKHDSPSEQLIFWVMFLIGGISTLIFSDIVLGALLGISLLMVVETIKMWSTPVWGQLMAATTATYLVILGGKLGQVIYDFVVKPDKPNDQIFSAAYNSAFYVFLIVSFYFFGKKFILVSRFSSPQVVYLFLFGVVYIFIAKSFPRDANNYVQNFNYLNISGEWRHRVLLADFGTYEALVIIMVFMYFISGWLLTVLFGVKPVTDEAIIKKVKHVAEVMGIKGDVKIGYVQAPILNAFAYGPWFDKRIAFISNDINEFSDEDIRGIVGHEFAHAANHHVLILLGLSIMELVIKKALLFPATTLDFTFTPDTAVQNIGFVGYYFFSYAILIILMIFVRILEGHADKKTLEAGYGRELAQALYRLEGFYNGVASDFGISVNLLTDRTYTIAEKRRFTAQAARNLYGEAISPSRGSAFANIFQSHPRTSYRILSMVDPKTDPIKGAFLSYRLLGFFLRKGAIRQLNRSESEYKKIIDDSYRSDYGEDALQEVMQYNPWKEPYLPYVGKEVIAFDIITKEVITGELNELKDSNLATSPLLAAINGVEVNLSKSVMRQYYPNEKYILKNGNVVTLTGHGLNKDGLAMDVVDAEGKKESINIMEFGHPVKFLDELKGKDVIFYNRGVSKLTTFDDYQINGNFFKGSVTLNGESYDSKNLIVTFPPLGFEVRKTRLESQIPLLNSLIGQKSLIFTKQNFDVSLAGFIKEVNEETLLFEDSDGEHEIKLDELEYVMTAKPSIELVDRSGVSLFTSLGIWWSNRNEFNYIF